MRIASSLAALVLVAIAPAAWAGTVFVNGALAGTDPTFARPNEGNPPLSTQILPTWFHDTYPFTVDLTGVYTIQTTAASLSDTTDDTFLVLYQTAFNPATPLVNALEADDDDGGGSFLSLISRSLTAGTQYIAVVTTFTSATTGTYTLQISGPGNISGAGLTVVPEPGTYALFGLGLTGLGGIVLRRRRAAKAAAAPQRS